MSHRRNNLRVVMLEMGLALLLARWCGCAKEQPGVERLDTTLGEPEPLSVVIARVNRNAAGMDFLLKGGGVTASGEFEHSDKRESFEFHGALLYRRPKNLYLKLDHVSGTLEAGSNEREFWLWEKFQSPRYSWGRHDMMGTDFDADLPLRPDLLAEILGLGDLPKKTTGPRGPSMWVGPNTYELMFFDYDAEDQQHLVKTIDIDRRAPFLVRSVVYFRPNGKPMMQAELSEYEKIEGSDVLAPRKIRIKWLPDRGWVDLTFTTMLRFESSGASKLFRSPLERGLEVGTIRRVDRPRPVSRPSTAPASRPSSRPATRPVASTTAPSVEH